ncbi:MAG: signal peptidase I [Oscillospiraceae bacterium]|nr:signal peptidase I [Oscillospiraceae bacterium]
MAEKQKKNAGLSFLWDVLDIAETAIATVFVFLLIFAYLLRTVTVDGRSMEPTLYDKDQILIVTSLYKPTNGDIIVINDEKGGFFADDAETSVYESGGLKMVIVKRLIAKGGDTIDIDPDNGTVAVNGKQLQEDYIKELTKTAGNAFTYPFTVPKGYLFVMGDNRMGSTDSRFEQVGLIPEDDVIGAAVMRYGRAEKLCKSWRDRFAWLL